MEEIISESFDSTLIKWIHADSSTLKICLKTPLGLKSAPLSLHEALPGSSSPSVRLKEAGALLRSSTLRFKSA